MNLLKAGLSTTKMCFVASTLVLCQVEGAARLEPIGGLESLAGDQLPCKGVQSLEVITWRKGQ